MLDIVFDKFIFWAVSIVDRLVLIIFTLFFLAIAKCFFLISEFPVKISNLILLFIAYSIILCLSPTIKILLLSSFILSIKVVLLYDATKVFPFISSLNFKSSVPFIVFKILS